jgi:hypothetical protein
MTIEGVFRVKDSATWEVEPTYDVGLRYHVSPTSLAGAQLGPSAPGFATNGSLGGASFIKVPEKTVYIGQPVLAGWDGQNDLVLTIPFTNQSGDVLQDEETVIFDFVYRAIAPGGSALDGDPVTLQIIYTQSGVGTDAQLLNAGAPQPGQTTAFIPRAGVGGSQAYDYNYVITGSLTYRNTSTYSNGVIVGAAVFLTPFDKVCHQG